MDTLGARMGEGAPLTPPVSLRRVHCSTDPLTLPLETRHYTSRGTYGKPLGGFWYAIEGAWIEFCRGRQSDRVGWHRYEVVLRDESRIHRITNAYEMLLFTNRFSHDGRYNREITWDEVAEQYDAVEVVPHMPELEDEFGWYYQWDLPSGVVLHPGEAVTRLELIEVCHWKESRLLSSNGNPIALRLDQER